MMIRKEFFEGAFVEEFSAAFQSRKPATFQNGVQVKAAVFPVAVWPNFLKDSAVKDLKDELSRMEFKLRSSDLYEFHQTSDLKHVDPVEYPLTAQICKELYSDEFLTVMQRVTGRKLGGHVDISGQRYQRGDFLLCHDDRLERRRIALILYLVPEGAELKGGHLWAMRSDEEGRPTAENPETVAPRWNTLAFFEVSRASFHQVEQVLSDDVFRYSITCWFHDPEGGGGGENDSTPVDDSEQQFEQKLPLSNLLPDECVLQLIKDIGSLGQDAFRLNFKGKFLSLSQYPVCEPEWMKILLRQSTVIALEEHFGLFLDWPTRPVAFLLSKGDFYLDSGIDKQGEFEYNYRERTVTSSTQKRMSLSILIPLDADSRPVGAPSLRTHFEPLEIRQFDSEKLLLVTMKYSVSGENLRFRQ